MYDDLKNKIKHILLLPFYEVSAFVLWFSLVGTFEAAGESCCAPAAEVEATNRKRKAEQTEAGPRLMRLEAEWVQGVKKNLEIESHCLRLEAEIKQMRDQQQQQAGGAQRL